MSNLTENLFAQALRQEDRPALVFGEESLSFQAIAREVCRVAGGLASIGVGVGSRVGLLMNSSPAFIFYQQAIFALGAVFTPLNVFYRSGEIAHAVQSCALEYLVVGGDLLGQLPAPGDPRLAPLKAVLTPGLEDAASRGLVAGETLLATSEPLAAPVQLPASALGMMLSTSATTGTSKGVMLSISNIQANYDRTPHWLGLTEETVTLCALALYNTFGLNQCINALMVTGGKLILMPRFEPLGCLKLIERHRCNFLPAVPTMLQKILDHPEAFRFDLRSLQRIMTGGAPVPATLLERIQERIGAGATVLTGYGLTEATALVTLDQVELGSDGRLLRPKCIGRVLEGMELRIFREDGNESAPHEVGEIRVRGPNVMLGYHGMPEDTRIALAGGWLHTGDLGYLDENGYGYIVDRKKDVIIRGGQNIYPADIEDVLYRLPGVCEAAVIGRPHPILGEVPVAFVAVGPGVALSAAEVLDACRSELAHFKVPAGVHFLPELPKGPTGKILRRALATEPRNNETTTGNTQ